MSPYISVIGAQTKKTSLFSESFFKVIKLLFSKIALLKEGNDALNAYFFYESKKKK